MSKILGAFRLGERTLKGWENFDSVRGQLDDAIEALRP